MVFSHRCGNPKPTFEVWTGLVSHRNLGGTQFDPEPLERKPRTHRGLALKAGRVVPGG